LPNNKVMLFQVSRECKSIIKKLLNSDPKKRLGAQDGAIEIKSA